MTNDFRWLRTAKLPWASIAVMRWEFVVFWHLGPVAGWISSGERPHVTVFRR